MTVVAFSPLSQPGHLQSLSGVFQSPSGDKPDRLCFPRYGTHVASLDRNVPPPPSLCCIKSPCVAMERTAARGGYVTLWTGRNVHVFCYEIECEHSWFDVRYGVRNSLS